jgi:flagellar hook-associated protein 2
MSSVSSTGSSGSTSALTSTSAATQILNGLNANGLSFSGLASGLDTSSIIQTLQQLGQQQVTNLQNQISAITTQETSFKGLDADLLDVQSQAEALSQSTNGVFNATTATVSDPTQVSAATSGSAVPGVYQFTVNNLARAQELASQGFSATTDTVALGTYTIQVGNGATQTLTVGSTNNTIQQFVNAINSDGGDVTASIVNNGGSSDPYQILLSSNNPGAANTINVGFTASGPSGGSDLDFYHSTIGSAGAGSGNTSTATVTSNAGPGSYTGTTNDTYTFTVASTSGTSLASGGTATLDYIDSTGTNTGSINLNSSNAGTLLAVAQGVEIQVGGTGVLNQGDTFTVNATISPVQAASDSSVTIGSGSGAVTVTNSSNLVSGLIPGVTLDLLSADPSTPVSVTVANDTTGVTSALQNFVTAYNQFINDVATDTAYDSSTQTAGPLLGNGDVANIQSQVQSALDAVVPGLPSDANNLTSIGLSVNSDGTLSLDSSTLSQVLSGQTGVTFANLQALFGLTGQSTNSGVQFLFGSNNTKASGTAPYQVNITQAATEGTLTGNTAPIAIASGDNTLAVTVNGVTSNTITLTPGTYSATQLAQQLQNQLNADPVLGNGAVTVTANSSNELVFTSQVYGSSSSVAVSGTAVSSLGLANAVSVTGQDVAGSFTVNNVTEAATGTGQTLTGNAGNANTDGLAVDVTLTSAQVGNGATANLTVTRGLASTLSQTLSSLTDPNTGQFQTIDAGYQAQIASLNTQITNDQNLLQQQQDALTTQFANLESIISNLKENSSVISTFASNASALSSIVNGGSSSNSNSGSNSSL